MYKYSIFFKICLIYQSRNIIACINVINKIKKCLYICYEE